MGPKIVEPLAMKKDKLAQKPTVAEGPKVDFIPAAGGYHLPELALLDYEESHEDKIDKGAMLALADKLQKTLADYGVKGTVAEIHPGPVVTMYEFVPGAGHQAVEDHRRCRTTWRCRCRRCACASSRRFRARARSASRCRTRPARPSS